MMVTNMYSKICLVLLGHTGSGKGTQAEMLKKEFKIPHIQTGDLFRDIVAKGTKLGIEIDKFMSLGELVPDEIAIDIILRRLNNDDCKNGFILDGFPRTLKQADALDKWLQEYCIKKVIFLKLKEKEVIKRIKGRKICEKCGKVYNTFNVPPKNEHICDICGSRLIIRKDDKDEIILRRLKFECKQLDLLVNFYSDKGILNVIDGKKNIFDVHKEILKALQEKIYR